MKDTISWEQVRGKLLNSLETRRAYEEAEREFKLRESLRQIKAKAKLTQKDIAKRLSLSTATVRRIEYYPTNVRIGHLIRYVHACNANINFSLSYRK